MIPEQGKRPRWVLLGTCSVIATTVVIAMVAFKHHDVGSVDFNNDIRPILNARCISCHGGVKEAGGFGLLFREDALEKTDSGKLGIVPGDADRSELIRRISLAADQPERMPKRGAPLSPLEIEKLRKWINDGAHWGTHWAYVAPRAMELPQVADRRWPIDPIDKFILKRIEAERLKPAPRADCAHLLRRVSLDLTGLPATYEATQAFCRDSSQEAYSRVVDRLLASPHFGERWASMWLDLARYADSVGYETDDKRSIWDYRDWVIKAFNRDLSFDQFTVEQLAGDLLPQPTADQLVATAFHRNTLTNNESGTDNEEFRTAAVIDRVGTTWEVWQGTTMQCVQCHSHPYDPFKHDDFYKLLAFFDNSQDADLSDDRPLAYRFDAGSVEVGQSMVTERDRLRMQMLLRARDPDIVAARRDWETRFRKVMQTPGHRAVGKDLVFDGHEYGYKDLKIQQLVMLDEAQRSGPEIRELVEFFAQEAAPQFATMRARVKTLNKMIKALMPVVTPVMLERPDSIRRVSHVFERGNWRAEGASVTADVPASMPPLAAGTRHDRLALARWLVSPDNPLTARVIVNRFWEQLFGLGIVESLGNFGTQGEQPTNQALLDWLAVHFRDDLNWSVKSLLREIVLSATYQQSSAASPELYARDPKNQLLARGPRFRLTAEAIRDQSLAVSGLLSDKMFGPPVMPPAPPDIWKIVYADIKWVESKGEDKHRRAIYTFVRKSGPYPSMETFDHPDRIVTVSQRVRTNTPLQALVTMNDPVFVEAADALADGMLAGGTPADRIRWAYRHALGRDPEAATLTALMDLYSRIGAEPPAHFVHASTRNGTAAGDDDLLARRAVANTILNLDAFLTKD